MLKRLLLGFGLLWLALAAKATHNRAGEIIFRNITGLTYEVTIITYTNFGNGIANKSALALKWGDGTADTLVRSNGGGEQIEPDVYKNIYKGIHTYPSSGTYLVSMADPYRNGDVINIPNSISVSFYVETVIVIDPFLEANNGPVLLNPPIDEACVGQPFYHNPSAYDPDGDSLSFRLVACRQGDAAGVGVDIPGYTFPETSNTFEIDPVTGDLTWDSPTMIGEYNLAIAIEEWRDGKKIGRVVRDMQVNVKACDNLPPVIDPIPDVCVKAEESVLVTINAFDPNGDDISISAIGGPFEVVNSAEFPQGLTGSGNISAAFRWIPGCEEIQFREYQVVVRVEDSGSRVNLVAYQTFTVKVIGPEVENVLVQAQGNNMNISWSLPYCENALGYDLYRNNKPTSYTPGDCEIGIPEGLGFQKIASIASGGNDSTYIDDNGGAGIPPGNSYCYRLVPIYPDESVGSVEGVVSEEDCAYIEKYLPSMTKVSIEATDVNNGLVDIEWSKPDTIDTNLYPGPYLYVVYEYDQNGTKFELGRRNNINDTILSGIPRNTVDAPWSYEIEFYNNTPGNVVLLGTSQRATSVFLEPQGQNEAVLLTWNNQVPWVNELYEIYRFNNTSGSFELIDVTPETSFKDVGLLNGVEYCYRVQSIGRYSSPGFREPLTNWSQEICAVAIDTVAPCVPDFAIENSCEEGRLLITWNSMLGDNCANDVERYDLYYQSSDFIQLLKSFPADVYSYEYVNEISVAGCYYVTATDTNGNTSNMSRVVCIDACPVFDLPNVFTPNNDGDNDLFVPIKSRYVGKLDMQIFGRFGNLVYRTEDLNINWDGVNQSSNNPCPEGVYYYVCTLYERTEQGLNEVTLSGFVHLFR